jgi:large subunit ribosomal protein L15
VVPAQALRARIVSSGGISRAVTIKGVHLTKGARAAVEAAGGKIEEVAAAK